MAAIANVTVDCPGCESPIAVPLHAFAAPSSADTLTVTLNADDTAIAEHIATAHAETEGT